MLVLQVLKSDKACAFFKKNYLFIFGCIGCSLLHTGFLQLRQAGATFSCSPQASHCGGFSCCGAQALGVWASVVVARGLHQLWLAGSRVQAQQLWPMGLVALWHVGSSRTKARTCVPCIGRQILKTTAPPGKSQGLCFLRIIFDLCLLRKF